MYACSDSPACTDAAVDWHGSTTIMPVKSDRYISVDMAIAELEKKLALVPTQLNDERVEVQRRIAAARSERNSLAPLASLSPELVRHVFELLQEPPPDEAAIPQPDHVDPDSDSSDASPQHRAGADEGAPHFLRDGWLAFANTCSWTRAVALGCPPLWARINCSSGERALRSAERAGDIPLALYLPPCADAASMQFLADHIMRAREVVYYGDEVEGDGLWQSAEHSFVCALNGACPRLEALTLVHYVRRKLLPGVYENLHTLVIRASLFCLDGGSMMHLPRLRDLTLHSPHIDDSVFEFVRMLNSLPIIERLALVDLDDCGKGSEPIEDLDANLNEDGADFTTLDLPSLKQLVLRTSRRSSAVFMRIIPLPSESLHVDIPRGYCDNERDELDQRSIVQYAHTFWTAATGRDTFDKSTFRADMARNLYSVRWAGAHGAKSVFVSTPMDPYDDPHAHECTTIEWTSPEEEVWEPLDYTTGPVLVNLRRVVLRRADSTFFPHGLENLKTWLVTQRAAGRKIDVVEFVKCESGEQANVMKALGGLGVEVIWR
jgi:hypothetical protein